MNSVFICSGAELSFQSNLINFDHVWQPIKMLASICRVRKRTYLSVYRTFEKYSQTQPTCSEF